MSSIPRDLPKPTLTLKRELENVDQQGTTTANAHLDQLIAQVTKKQKPTAPPPAIPNPSRSAFSPFQKIEAKHEYAENLPLKVLTKPELKGLTYVLCNEEGQEKILKQMELEPLTSNGVHLGFSCWLNYDLIAIRKPAFSIICDIDPNMIAMLNLIESLVEISETPDEFLKNFDVAITSRFSEDAFKKFPPLYNNISIQDFDHFKSLLSKNGWLSSIEKYQTVKQCYKEGRITHQFLDISDNNGIFSDLSNWAIYHGLVFDTIYDSNIQEWFSGSSLELIHKNLDTLKDKQTNFITAWKRVNGKGSPELEMCQGKQPVRTVTVPKRNLKILTINQHGNSNQPRRNLFDSL